LRRCIIHNHSHANWSKSYKVVFQQTAQPSFSLLSYARSGTLFNRFISAVFSSSLPPVFCDFTGKFVREPRTWLVCTEWPADSQNIPGSATRNPVQQQWQETPSFSTAREFGLKVIHEPYATTPSVDRPSSSSSIPSVSIIFVHGLGGSSRDTWTHPESKVFWPTLLRETHGLEAVRISTFGYDANFVNVMKPKSVLGIADFAEQLLDALDLFYHKYGDVALLSIRLNLVPDYICGAQYGWAGCEEGVPSFDPT
jgi:hypothetical protein